MLQKVKQLLIILILIWTENVVIGWRNYEIVFSNVVCNFISKHINFFNCSTYKLPNNYSAISITFVTTEDIYVMNARSRGSLLRDGDKPIILSDHTFDACEMLEGKVSSAGLQIVIAQLRSNNITNLPSRCPLEKNKKYYVKDLYIDTEQLPPYTPYLKFKYYIKLYENDKITASLEVQGGIEPKEQITKKKRS